MERAVAEACGGRGADVVFEVAGGADTFQTAWKIARPNAVVMVVAMYEESQQLPLPQMYGKNLTFKTGGVDGCDCGRIMELLEAGKLEIDPAAEDIHTFIEAELTARIGDAGKRLHTARSRNDQVALDLRLYLEEQIVAVHGLICQLLEELCAQAEKSAFAIMPGYTHMQRAQPVHLNFRMVHLPFSMCGPLCAQFSMHLPQPMHLS